MLRSWFCLFFCLVTYASCAEENSWTELSTPEAIAALNLESEYLIGGIVSPLGGHAALRKTDLTVPGAQSLTLTRVYIPPHIPSSFSDQPAKDKLELGLHVGRTYKGWQFFPHTKLYYNFSTQTYRVTDPSGITLEYKIVGTTSQLVSPLYAISNAVAEVPSGKNDPRNTKLLHQNKNLIVHSCDGTRRIYVPTNFSLFLLQQEILPNGKVIKYHYNDKQELTYVESLDPQERFVYASLRLSGSAPAGTCQFLTSTGLSAQYHYQQRLLEGTVKEKNSKRPFRFLSPPLLTSVKSPFYAYETLDYCDRFLLCHAFGKEDVAKFVHRSYGSEPHYRIHQILLPVGNKESFLPVYEMHYQPPVAGKSAGFTEVKNKDGTKTIYHFDKQLLCSAIKYYDAQGSLQKQKLLKWSDNQWLISVTMRDGENHLLYKKSYEYDNFGNPILETFTAKGIENSIKREFSQDGLHLLLKEAHHNGLRINYSYLPGTNLLTAKLTKDHGKLIFQELYEYDDCHNLIKTQKDQKIYRYILRQSAPFLHLPEWVEESYLDGAQEKLLKRTQLLYDTYGNVAEEKVFDADGKYAYTLTKKYNERGDLLSKTNALGQKNYLCLR